MLLLLLPHQCLLLLMRQSRHVVEEQPSVVVFMAARVTAPCHHPLIGRRVEPCRGRHGEEGLNLIIVVVSGVLMGLLGVVNQALVLEGVEREAEVLVGVEISCSRDYVRWVALEIDG